MTEAEAIKWVDDRMCYGRGKWSKHHRPQIDEYWQAGELAIKALKKQITMKPIVTLPNWKNGIPFSVDCPTCGNYLTTKVKRCEECGQLIDWSDYETD